MDQVLSDEQWDFLADEWEQWENEVEARREEVNQPR